MGKDSKETLCFSIFVVLSFLGKAHSDCSDPGNPANADRYVSSFSTGSNVTFQCHTGYEMQGGLDLLTLECESSGHWSGSILDCNKVECGDPGPTDNTTYSGDYFYNDVVEYNCIPGYRMDDWSSRLRVTCQADKTWDPEPQGCVRIECIDPEVIPNANMTSQEGPPYWLDVEVTYECGFGYRPRNPAHSTMVCGDDGFWDGTWPECLRIRCGDPGMVDNAGRIVTGNGAGTVLIYSCNRGYYHDPESGALNRTCQENATWTGTGQPACLGLYCGAPNAVANSTFTVSPQTIPENTPTYRFPETLKYTCDEGFRANYTLGIDEITCTFNGQWDFLPSTCDRVRCIETSMSQNTVINNAYYYYTDVKEMQCLNGYELTNGSLVRSCLATGYFSDSPPICSKVECPDPRLDSNHNQNVDIEIDGYAYRDMVTFTCHDGYEITGGQSLTFRQSAICQADRSWAPALPVCTRVSCGEPDLRLYVNLESYEGHYYGDEVSFNCSEGYEHDSGNQISYCQEDRRWSGDTFECIERACPALSTFDNGERIGSNFRYRGQVSFRCNSGFELVGEQTIKCLIDGTWNHPEPSCQPISCNRPETIQHATWTSDDDNATSYAFGEEVTYACSYGYFWRDTSGPLTRSCTQNKRWSDRRPICDPYPCVDPGEVEGTYKLGIRYSYGQKVNYTCATGYETQSGQQWSALTCDMVPNSNTADWVGTIPTCERIYCGDPGPGGNATRFVRADYYYSDTIRYYCNENYYYPDGRYMLRCLETKNWSAPVPHCIISPEFEPVAQVQTEGLDQPSEAEDATTYGYIGIALMGGEVLAIIILDLATIQKEIELLRRNLNCKKKPKKEVEPEEKEEEKVEAEADSMTQKARLQAKFRAGGFAALQGVRMGGGLAMATRTGALGPPPYSKGHLTPVEGLNTQDPPPYAPAAGGGMSLTTAALLRMRAQRARAAQQGKLKTEIQKKEEEEIKTQRSMSIDMSARTLDSTGATGRRMSLQPPQAGGMSVAQAMMLKMRAQKARKLQKKSKKNVSPPPAYSSGGSASHSMVLSPSQINPQRQQVPDDDSDDDWDQPRKRGGKKKVIQG